MESSINHRCQWAGTDPLYISYHDLEWGVPVYEDKKLYEFLILEGAQAGLSWITILKKRENYRMALDNFNPEKIAFYDHGKIELLLQNEGLIRNRRKLEAVVQNARSFLKIQKEYGTFADFIWQFTNGQPINNNWKSCEEVPVKTKISDRMSKELKNRGFKFVGSIICYSFMQAVGMVNDHTTNCFRHSELICSK